LHCGRVPGRPEELSFTIRAESAHVSDVLLGRFRARLLHAEARRAQARDASSGRRRSMRATDRSRLAISGLIGIGDDEARRTNGGTDLAALQALASGYAMTISMLAAIMAMAHGAASSILSNLR